MLSKCKRTVTLKQSLEHPTLQQLFAGDSEARIYDPTMRPQTGVASRRVNVIQKSANQSKRNVDSIERSIINYH